MIDLEVSTAPLPQADVDLLVVAAAAQEDGAPVPGEAAREVAGAIDVDLPGELERLSFEAEPGESARIPTRRAVPAPMALVVGVGSGDGNAAAARRLRRAGAAAADASERIASLALAAPTGVDGLAAAGAARALVEGVMLGAYRFEHRKNDPTPHELERIVVHTTDGAADELRAALDRAAAGVEAATLVRDLVNEPPGDKRPPALADRAVQAVADLPVGTRVLDEDDLAEGGYGGLLGVGAGSQAPPRLVELTWRPDGADRHVALVGKGITFDSGGLSLKSPESMEWMKVDMAGAACVLGAVAGAARLQLPVAVTGLMALAENMPGGGATRPGDVLTSHGGTTIEVLNTDAEGRLVLADALGHASRLEPDAIVDLATLTGAAVVALGPDIGALMSTDDELAAALEAAADAAGEPLWRLPVATEQYGEDLEGTVADVQNSGWKGAGTIRAGLFLHRFVEGDIPWAHLDIAGVAWAEEHDGPLRKGATGVPVRTLLEWLAEA